MELKNILYSEEEGIAVITLNRPEKLNALNVDTFNELYAALDDAENKVGIRVIVITGAGRAFCAGDDIEGLRSLDTASGAAFAKVVTRTFAKLEQVEKPTIAAVNGIAMGGGFEIALLCDITIATEHAKFSLPEPRVGVYAGIAAPRLAEVIGAKRAKELLLTAKVLDAYEAERIGLVNKVVPDEQLSSAVKEVAKMIMELAPLAVSATKLAVNRHWLADEYHYSSVVNNLLFQTEDAKEGVNAFLTKRKPLFKGR